MSAPTLDSIAVLDANEIPWPTNAYREQVCAWLRRHRVDPMATHRVEVFLLDAPFARVYQHDADADGKVKWDENGKDVVCRDPFDVPLTELPPGGRRWPVSRRWPPGSTTRLAAFASSIS